MTDRELLEAAAKAAGLQVEWMQWPSTAPGFLAYKDGKVSEKRGESYTPWRPLTDDGDALRLVRSLGMVLDYSVLGANEVRFWVGQEEAPRAFGFDPNMPSDEGRAIVRAAAEIGRAASSRAGDGI